jgi:hypothetical protein
MSEAKHVYTPPHTVTANAVPTEVVRYLAGTDLLTKTQALRLSTVDSAGWPHAALLSAGDMVVLSSERIRFALFPESTTVANLRRDGRITITPSSAASRLSCTIRKLCCHVGSDRLPHCVQLSEI